MTTATYAPPRDLNPPKIKAISKAWDELSSVMTIRNATEFKRAAAFLDQLLDTIGDDESHRLYGLIDVLGTMIHAYEEKHHPWPSNATGVDVLRYLMDEHGLNQSDLPEIGKQSVVSEVLSGKRTLSKNHIAALAKRFHVSPSSFFDEAEA